MNKLISYVAFLSAVFLSINPICAQYESGGFGGFYIQLMNFGSAGFGVANGGLGGAIFRESGFIGGFGFGGTSTKQNKTVNLGYGGIFGGARVEISNNHKLAFGSRLGLGALSNVAIDENGDKTIISNRFVRLEPNVIYDYQIIDNFHFQIQVGYSFNLIGNLKRFDTTYMSLGFMMGMF
ncbi:MAG: hypothetical protein ACK4EX_09925 [Thermaurantimonas sp.]|uniref:hypothetical protein n=1 Tax=Thermaurantimonas sp. TaxID=2681568 RepID=UPI00391876BB